jgi:hypothetical protein
MGEGKSKSGGATGAEAGGGRSSPWNSLEVARLIMASGTPLAIFVMGFVLTQQSARQAATREQAERAQAAAEQRRDRAAAAAVDRRIRQETLARDDALRRAGEARDDAIRRAADERDDALRAAAQERDLALRNDTIARDAAARRETVKLARLSTILQKRIEIWDRIGPIMPALYVNLRSEHPDRGGGPRPDRGSATGVGSVHLILPSEVQLRDGGLYAGDARRNGQAGSL